MDDANTLDQPPATRGAGESTQPPDRDRFQTMTEACSVMKDEIASTAQQIVGDKQRLGKPPTMTDACSVMKGEIDDEARQILSTPQPPVQPPTFTAASDSIAAETAQLVPNVETEKPLATSEIEGAGDTDERFAGEDADDRRFYLHPIEQAQKAIREAQWFEQ
jgi:hypothetical protein